MKRLAQSLAVVSVVALALTACSSKPKNDSSSPSSGGQSSSTPPASNASFKACMVSDTGGFNDKSFNETSLKGLTDAVSAYGISMAKIQSTSPSQYTSNINAMISANCKMVITVGFDLGDATEKAAKANPDVDFAIVDYSYTDPPSNLKGLVFNTAQPAFMAGYLAAGMSTSGIVGTFGGQKLSTVTIYMDGFYDGVQFYNQQNGKNVQVIGWNEGAQNGTFTNDFSTKVKGQTTAQNMIQQGADVIFPVAGGDGLGALQAAQDSNGKVTAIWVDTDGCVERGVLLPGAAELGREGPRRFGPAGHRVRPGQQVQQCAVHRHAAEQRRRFCAVPRLREQDPEHAAEPDRPGQGRPHEREDHDQVAVHSSM